MRFYIGNDPQKQHSEGIGVAGEAFLTKEIRIAHMDCTEKGWTCTSKYFKEFSLRAHDPVYRSFVCMPIYGPPDAMTKKPSCLGVVCFDSQNRTLFDLEDVGIILRAFARRIATVLIVYRLLSEETK